MKTILFSAQSSNKNATTTKSPSFGELGEVFKNCVEVKRENSVIKFETRNGKLHKHFNPFKTSFFDRTLCISLVCLLFLPFGKAGKGFAQNVGINATGAAPDVSALLDIDAAPGNNKGLLIPRVALTAINSNAPIGAGIATSLLVYNTATAGTPPNNVTPGYYYWDGSKWVALGGSGGKDWSLLGNAGTIAGTNFLGTTDNQALSIRTNNTEKVRITTNGNVGIGTAAPISKLHVNHGSIYVTNNSWSHVILFSYNNSDHPYFLGARGRGTDVSPLYPLIGDVLNSFIGRDAINYQSANYGGASIYMYASENFSATNKGTNIVFNTTTNGSNNETEKMRLEHNGNLGIGTAAPITKLHVADTHPGAGPGTGVNSDAPTQAIIPAGSDGSSRQNDWPNNWGGGLSTWDICGSGAYFSGYVTRSDSRYKKNINPLENNKTDISEKFMQIQPVSYFLNPETIKSDSSELQRKRFGFIANEIEKLFPNLVVNAGMPESIYRGLEYDGFIPLLVFMVQQQKKEIDSLQKEVGSLQKENALLKSYYSQQQAEINNRIKKLEVLLGAEAKK